jgi:hypothetical protein
LVGGSTVGSVLLHDSGGIFSGKRIASVTIGGSLIAGSHASAGTLSRCGFIVAEDELGPVRIGGNILGNSTHAALIMALGQDIKPTTGFDMTIASITVAGDVRYAQILAGFYQLSPANADASIGPVTVGGDWIASSLVAGAQDSGTPGFGVGDILHSFGDTPLVARIASITIKCDVTGSLLTGDHFGFVAQRIDGLKIRSQAVPLTAANDNVAISFTSDVRLLEVG